MMTKVRLGLIVNPIAGMGGRVGLKGTDGEAVVLARERGAIPLAGLRAEDCLRELLSCRDQFDLWTGAGNMGEEAARRVGFAPSLVGEQKDVTSAGDTEAIAARMSDVDLLLFAGGDGTARNVCAAVGEKTLALGIPAGVKIHSAVFASSPGEAGRLAAEFVSGGHLTEKLSEVMDIDEDAYRKNLLKAVLHGYLKTPWKRGRVQGLKSGSPSSDAEAQSAIGEEAAAILRAEKTTLFFIGAGTTTRAILTSLGVQGTLLGVDAWFDGQLVGTDLAERDLLRLMEEHPSNATKIVVTPIGGQGFIFGRGNQQFSPEVIRRAGVKNIVPVSTPAKFLALGGAPLLVDTGDGSLDLELEGYVRVISGYGQYTLYKVRRG